MVEHLSVGPEGKFKDETVVRSGEFSGLNCKWELHALPQFLESDLKLTSRIVRKVSWYLENNKLTDATVDLVEGYDGEPLTKEHYRLLMVFGNGGSNNEELVLSKHYLAYEKDDEKKETAVMQGSVRVKLVLPNVLLNSGKELLESVADIYIPRMEKAYPELKNDWEESVFTPVK